MDLLALTFVVIIGGSLVFAGALLLLTYIAFVRMNRDVRRARMFLMADRVGRFLGAFTAGFLLVAVAALVTIVGFPAADLIFSGVIFLFLAAIVYGSLELFLIIRPRPRRPTSVTRPDLGQAEGDATNGSPGGPSTGGDRHAAR